MPFSLSSQGKPLQDLVGGAWPVFFRGAGMMSGSHREANRSEAETGWMPTLQSLLHSRRKWNCPEPQISQEADSQGPRLYQGINNIKKKKKTDLKGIVTERERETNISSIYCFIPQTSMTVRVEPS